MTITYYRPVPSFIPVSQTFGSNPTADLPTDHWLIRTFGDYQPRGHTGIDYAADEGTDVYAVTDGTVLWADWATSLPGDDSHYGWLSRWYISKSFAGIVLVIDHGEFLGIYAHLSRTDLNSGDTVRGGERIAASGNTGGSTGPHLHFEIVGYPFNWANGMYGRIDPARYLTTTTTQSIGYTGATIGSAAPDTDWTSMATKEELREVVEAVIRRELTYKRPKLGGATGQVSIQDEILHTASNVARLDRKLDAIVTACNAILDRPDFTADPEAAYAAIGRATVAALKEDPR